MVVVRGEVQLQIHTKDLTQVQREHPHSRIHIEGDFLRMSVTWAVERGPGRVGVARERGVRGQGKVGGVNRLF